MLHANSRPRLSPFLALALASGMVRADASPLRNDSGDGAAATAGAATSIGDVDRALSDIDQEERTVRADLDALGPRRHDLEARVRARGRLLFRLVRAGMLPIAGGVDAFLDHALRVDRVRHGLERDANDLAAARARTIELGRRLDDLSTRRAPLLIQQQAEARARAALDEVDERKRAFARAFDDSKTASDYIAVYGGGIDSDDGAEGSFASRKGRLPLPVAGRAELRIVPRGALPGVPGERAERAGAGGPGVEIRAPEGATVRAVSAGRVAFADRYDPLGSVVIVDHGDHYFTLVGNLGTTDVRVGDDLSAGARLGTVGVGSKGAYVYFEVRRGGEALDPRPWLGIR